MSLVNKVILNEGPWNTSIVWAWELSWVKAQIFQPLPSQDRLIDCVCVNKWKFSLVHFSVIRRLSYFRLSFFVYVLQCHFFQQKVSVNAKRWLLRQTCPRVKTYFFSTLEHFFSNCFLYFREAEARMGGMRGGARLVCSPYLTGTGTFSTNQSIVSCLNLRLFGSFLPMMWICIEDADSDLWVKKVPEKIAVRKGGKLD